MKKEITYLTIIFYSILLFSCSNEEIIIPSQSEKIIEMPVAIEIHSGKADEIETRADKPTVSGTCNVNEILLLIYSGTSTDKTQLVYTDQKTLSCAKENGKWVARGTINGEANKNYAIFALGYNKENESGLFSATPATSTLYGDTRISLTTTQYNDYVKSYRTPELFAGNVMPKNATSEVFAADGEVSLTGTLYRSVGKCTLTLTDIPKDVTKLSWLTEKISEYNLLYRNWIGKDNYPMGIPSEEEQTDAISEISTIEKSADGTWPTNTLESFFIPLSKSRFFVDVTNATGTTRYQIKCAGKWQLTIWIGILGYGVENYKFTITPNYLLSINGPFETLKNSGNMLLDLSEMEEVNGGFIKPIIE